MLFILSLVQGPVFRAAFEVHQTQPKISSFYTTGSLLAQKGLFQKCKSLLSLVQFLIDTRHFSSITLCGLFSWIRHWWIGFEWCLVHWLAFYVTCFRVKHSCIRDGQYPHTVFWMNVYDIMVAGFSFPSGGCHTKACLNKIT